MVQRSDQLRVKCLLTEAITLLCKSGLTYVSQLSIEGLLGITLDHGDIFLVNINETVHSDHQMAPQFAADGGLLVGPAPDVASEIVIVQQNEGAELDLSGRLGDEAGLAGVPKIAAGAELGEGAGLVVVEAGLDDDGDSEEAGLGGEEAGMDVGLVGALGEGDCTPFTDDIFCGGKQRKLALMDGELGSSVFNSDDIASLLGKVAPPAGDDDNYDDGGGGGAQPIKVECFGRAAVGTRVYGDAVDGELTGWELDTQQDAMPLNLAGDHSLPDAEPGAAGHGGNKKCGQCAACGKWYRSKQGLKKHRCALTARSGTSEVSQPLDLTVVRATGGASYTCEACSRTFADYATCVAHTCVTWRVCDVCGARLRSHSGYAKHRRRHVGAFKLHCALCHKGFFDRTHLRAHTDAAHSKVRRHTCDRCQKSFFWKHHLKRHLTHCGAPRGVGARGGGGGDGAGEAAGDS